MNTKMIWFTSDWHIGHDKNFIWEARGFKDVVEHDIEILKRCNNFVKPEDELWILGDLALGQDESEWDRIFYNINCKNVHFISGNHDTNRKECIYNEKYCFRFHGYAEVIRISKRIRLYLSHYPTIVSNFDDDTRIPLINLYGHTHQKDNFYNNNPYMYHVGLDSHNCYPVSIEQIKFDIETKRRILSL